jgi:hypothetical protein
MPPDIPFSELAEERAIDANTETVNRYVDKRRPMARKTPASTENSPL